jgi:hypothetical protein
VGLKLNGTYQLLVYAYLNLLGDNTDIIQKNTESLTNICKEVDPEANAKNSMLLSRHQNGGQNHDVKKAKRSFENVAQFKYLVKTVSNQNLIHEEIKKRFLFFVLFKVLEFYLS